MNPTKQEKIDLTDIWGQPRLYKGIKIYPVKMKDIDFFYNTSYPLMIDKDGLAMTFQDPRIIKMSYLDFFVTQICEISNEDGSKMFPNGLKDLLAILKLVLRNQEVGISQNIKTYKIILTITLENGQEVTIRGNEFDKFKKIILKQNNAYTEKPKGFHPEIQKQMDKAIQVMNRKNKDKMATLEEQIASYSVATNTPLDKIREMTIYQFDFNIGRMSLIMNCQMSWAMASEALKCGAMKSENIPTWLQHIPKSNIYDEILVSGSELNKFEGV